MHVWIQLRYSNWFTKQNREFHCDGHTVQRGKHQILGDSLVQSLQTLTSRKDMLKVTVKN